MTAQDRLLTDAELEGSIKTEYEDFRVADESDRSCDILFWTRESQDAKTARTFGAALADFFEPYIMDGRDGIKRLYWNNVGYADLLTELRAGRVPGESESESMGGTPE